MSVSPDERPTRGLLDPATFKAVMARFASGVAVITTKWNEAPVGFTVTSFTSVSLEPPLVSFCIAETASNWPAIRVASGFVIHILGERQQALSALFSRKGADRFGPSTRWRPNADGLPVLADVLAHLECDIVSIAPAGDHHVVLGQSVGGEHHANEVNPLVYFRGSYRGLLPPTDTL